MKQWIVLGALMTSGSAFAHVSSCHDFTCAYPEFYKTWTEHLSAHAEGRNPDETIRETANEHDHSHGHPHEDDTGHAHHATPTTEVRDAPKLARRGHRTESAQQVDSILAEYDEVAKADIAHETPAPVEAAPIKTTSITVDVIPEGAIHVGEIGSDPLTDAVKSEPESAPSVVNTKVAHAEHHNEHKVEPYKIAYPDGSTYRGDINKGRRHGYGVMTWPDGTRYLGQFFNDQYHGHGQLRWADGTSYTGNFAHDELQGKGAMAWADGIRFNGEMDHSQRHGKGTYTLPDGRRVVGIFTNDHAAGQGLLIYPDGRHRGIIFGKDVAIKHRGLPGCLHNSVPGCR